MGNCGSSQIASGPRPLGSHGLCPYFYNYAFEHTFPAIPKPKNCRSNRNTSVVSGNFSMGYKDALRYEGRYAKLLINFWLMLQSQSNFIDFQMVKISLPTHLKRLHIIKIRMVLIKFELVLCMTINLIRELNIFITYSKKVFAPSSGCRKGINRIVSLNSVNSIKHFSQIGIILLRNEIYLFAKNFLFNV